MNLLKNLGYKFDDKPIPFVSPTACGDPRIFHPILFDSQSVCGDPLIFRQV